VLKIRRKNALAEHIIMSFKSKTAQAQIVAFYNNQWLNIPFQSIDTAFVFPLTHEIADELERVGGEAHPIIQTGLEELETATSRFTNECIFIDYKPVAAASSYALPRVMLEFVARSTGAPANVHEIRCDIEEYIEEVSFPVAHPRVMELARIFWEKATAIHVYCAQGGTGLHDRFSRHLHDLMRLEEAGFIDHAIQARDIAEAVALHKSAFFIEKDSAGNRIDYTAAVRGGLCLVPEEQAKEALRTDYQRMVDDGLLMEDAEPFDHLIEACGKIQVKANSILHPEGSQRRL
jgi:hypothetical protein